MSLAKTGQPDRRLQPMATMPPIPVEELDDMLSRLRLTAIRDQLDNLLEEAARKELNLREALTWLCAAEIARKDQRRIAMAMSIAKFPFVRTLEGFEYEAQPSLDPGQIRELATCRWVANGDTLLLLGPPGVGKTHLAVALGREAVNKGYTVQYVSAMELRLPRFSGQVVRSHAMTLRLSIDDQPDQIKTPVHGAAKARGH